MAETWPVRAFGWNGAAARIVDGATRRSLSPKSTAMRALAPSPKPTESRRTTSPSRVDCWRSLGATTERRTTNQYVARVLFSPEEALPLDRPLLGRVDILF